MVCVILNGVYTVTLKFFVLGSVYDTKHLVIKLSSFYTLKDTLRRPSHPSSTTNSHKFYMETHLFKFYFFLFNFMAPCREIGLPVSF